MNKKIVIAGATGNLGQRIAMALRKKNAIVYALIRKETDKQKIAALEIAGVICIPVDFQNKEEIAEACKGASCVISSLSGLDEVILHTQKIVLDAAIHAGVPRFIPSDYSIDFTNLPAGNNRNLDLRRAFHTYLDEKKIAATSIFNGPFTELLTGDMPMILFKKKRILYWGNAQQQIDFTTMDDTAVFTAYTALEDSGPRYLRIAGDSCSPKEMAEKLTAITGSRFKLLRAGGLGLLKILIKIAKLVAPGKKELYPAWQGMQYMRDMMDGRGKMQNLDNNRFPEIKWVNINAYLTTHSKEQNTKN